MSSRVFLGGGGGLGDRPGHHVQIPAAYVYDAALEDEDGGGRAVVDGSGGSRFLRGVRWGGVLVLESLFVLVVCVGGGLLNRMRGGWLRIPNPNSPHDASMEWRVLTHDLVPRLVVFALPLGMAVAASARRSGWGVWQRAALGLATTLLTWLSLWVGYGTYMELGRDARCHERAVGVFDWLLGRCAEDWRTQYVRRWMHDASGMSMRGLVATGPVGIVFYHVGLGWETAVSGSLMGLIYDLGWRIRSARAGFERGTPMWGAWLFAMTLLPILAYRHAPRAPLVGSTTAQQISANALVAFASLLFLVSVTWYGILDDTRSARIPRPHQSVGGLASATSAMLLGLAALVLRTLRYRRHVLQTGRRDDSDLYFANVDATVVRAAAAAGTTTTTAAAAAGSSDRDALLGGAGPAGAGRGDCSHSSLANEQEAHGNRGALAPAAGAHWGVPRRRLHARVAAWLFPPHLRHTGHGPYAAMLLVLRPLVVGWTLFVFLDTLAVLVWRLADS